MASIQKRGRYQWQAIIRRKGHPTQTKTFETKAQAEAWKLAAQFIVARDGIDVMVKSQHAQCTHVGANGDAGVAFFKAAKGLTRDAHPLSTACKAKAFAQRGQLGESRWERGMAVFMPDILGRKSQYGQFVWRYTALSSGAIIIRNWDNAFRHSPASVSSTVSLYGNKGV